MTRIEEIEAREKAAMPGPWEDVRQDDEPDVAIVSGGTVIAQVGDFFPEAKFVAHAREDIPYLLAQLREARGKLEAVEKASVSYGYSQAKEFMDAIDRILHPQEAE